MTTSILIFFFLIEALIGLVCILLAYERGKGEAYRDRLINTLNGAINFSKFMGDGPTREDGFEGVREDTNKRCTSPAKSPPKKSKSSRAK